MQIPLHKHIGVGRGFGCKYRTVFPFLKNYLHIVDKSDVFCYNKKVCMLLQTCIQSEILL